MAIVSRSGIHTKMYLLEQELIIPICHCCNSPWHFLEFLDRKNKLGYHHIQSNKPETRFLAYWTGFRSQKNEMRIILPSDIWLIILLLWLSCLQITLVIPSYYWTVLSHFTDLLNRSVVYLVISCVLVLICTTLTSSNTMKHVFTVTGQLMLDCDYLKYLFKNVSPSDI